jgi:tRNA(adenine34) deaminase
MASIHQQFMQSALDEARKASSLGEVPIGAVAVFENQIIARAHNEVEMLKDATAHAEHLVVQRASKHLNNWRLNGVSIYVTLEPCSMCVGAMILSRVEKLYFGAKDPRQGAAGSIFDITQDLALPHQLEVISGVLEAESVQVLGDFFTKLRK